VLQSREVRLAVVQDTFRFPDMEATMTFLEYANRPPSGIGLVLKYTLKLPWTVKEAFVPERSSILTEDRKMPSEEQDRALEMIAEKVSTSVNEETGLMTISVTAGEASLSAELAESFVTHLRRRVRAIRTEKTREQLAFVKSRFQEVEGELETAEDQLAQFLERNQNPTTASLQFRRDRLQRQVSFKEQLYSELQSQLTQVRLDLQRRQPVVTVVEAPVPPIEQSAPKRGLILVISFILGGALGIISALLKEFLFVQEEDSSEGEKLNELIELVKSGPFL
jgi:uncharacterized protein involved in exopolysaccharide biosynthesis